MFLERFSSETHALLRIVAGFLFLCHGMQKLFSFPTAAPPEAPPAILYTAGPIELLGGLLIMIGLFTRWAAFLCSGTMAVAYFMVHQPMRLLPIQNRGELAALYCWAFLLIAASGDGVWSLARRRAGAQAS